MPNGVQVPVAAQRLFVCNRCRAQVVVCSPCDRGQRYCGSVCARLSRLENQRASNRRYQATPRGRNLHAERQTRYRREQARPVGVTEQGASGGTSAPHGLAALRPNRACAVCGAARTPFLRLDPNRSAYKRRREPTASRRKHPGLGQSGASALFDRQNCALSDRR